MKRDGVTQKESVLKWNNALRLYLHKKLKEGLRTREERNDVNGQKVEEDKWAKIRC